MDFIYAIVLGIIEGLTEFLPISSTGHLLVASAFLNFPTAALQVPDPKAFRDTFSIFIQSGAVLAVIAFYWRDLAVQARRITQDRSVQRFWLGILIAFAPAAGVGFALRDVIKAALFTPLVVGIALVIGGLIFLLIERHPRTPHITKLEAISLREALLIGAAQVTALVPGVSRSGASIVGSLLIGLDRPTATAFSFYLAIPTLGLATLFDLLLALRDGTVLSVHLPLFGTGALVSFVVAWLAMAWLLRYVSRHSFRLFGYYRIAAGALIIALAHFTSILAN
ncbi:MAG: undecaprenyl-diphosphate phosphatase [Candidatus Thermofonsia Clade 1 bacterium]|jgi:undecaprenyl-diphosphatase|uniref:Undecaprenyl-diphosphatase n=1 Tax=Candidatus Thermofonsia Clade 1 bacterium TaxID=2364210 RepID=A0A2M8PGC5_9CHLR|nr:MAG: undecaprenyl-diphosphate phosphatase [Candidatus Thermofonsia Clade 1 bacterium]RMF52767.1 MAG: undecaprenyl-diphosphate phosphatase [Chloroflexota bacterium]